MTKKIRPLTKPLSKAAIRRRMVDGVLRGVVLVSLNEVVDAARYHSWEGFWDLLSVKLVGDDLLMDVSYRVVGTTKDGMVMVEVKGDPTAVLA